MSPTTYTYGSGAEETFDLFRGPQTPEGYVVASFKYSDGEVSDGYVSLEWLRNRLDELSPVTTNRRADDITDEMVQRAAHYMAKAERPVSYAEDPNRTAEQYGFFARDILTAALTEPVSRPENAKDIEQAMKEFDGDFEAYGFAGLADHLAEKGFQFVPDTSKHCGLGPCCLNDGHSGSCTM